MLRKKSISERRAIQSSARDWRGKFGSNFLAKRVCGKSADSLGFCGEELRSVQRICRRMRNWESRGSFRDSVLRKQEGAASAALSSSSLRQRSLGADADTRGCG